VLETTSSPRRRQKNRRACIQIRAAGEGMGMDTPDTVRTAPEVTAYAFAAQSGDVFPVCMKLAETRSDGAWGLRMALIRHVGPACPAAALDRACELMPHAVEPLLLRAARSLAMANLTMCAARRAWLKAADADLVAATKLDAMDVTARALLAERIGACAWVKQTLQAA